MYNNKLNFNINLYYFILIKKNELGIGYIL